MVVLKELQHDDDDSLATRNADYIDSLRGCGLLKFLCATSMIYHARLLEYILHMWNPEQHHFEVGPHILTVEVEDIYFLTRLST